MTPASQSKFGLRGEGEGKREGGRGKEEGRRERREKRKEGGETKEGRRKTRGRVLLTSCGILVLFIIRFDVVDEIGYGGNGFGVEAFHVSWVYGNANTP